MNNARGSRSSKSIRMHMRHNIMSPPLLLYSRGCEFLVLNSDVVFQLLDRFLGDVESELFLGFCEVHPELSPRAEAVAGREDVLHLCGAVARIEGTVRSFSLSVVIWSFVGLEAFGDV